LRERRRRTRGLRMEAAVRGRVLGLDFGLRRVGAAISDPGRTIASPLEVYERTSETADRRHYRRLVEEHEVERIVVGLPVHTSGREGDLASRARAWGGWLATVTGRPVDFHDERYTSVEAEDLMIRSGLKRRRRKSIRDMLAAQIMLQDYLDRGCSTGTSAAMPLADSEGIQP